MATNSSTFSHSSSLSSSPLLERVLVLVSSADQQGGLCPATECDVQQWTEFFSTNFGAEVLCVKQKGQFIEGVASVCEPLKVTYRRKPEISSRSTSLTNIDIGHPDASQHLQSVSAKKWKGSSSTATDSATLPFHTVIVAVGNKLDPLLRKYDDTGNDLREIIVPWVKAILSSASITNKNLLIIADFCNSGIWIDLLRFWSNLIESNVFDQKDVFLVELAECFSRNCSIFVQTSCESQECADMNFFCPLFLTLQQEGVFSELLVLCEQQLDHVSAFLNEVDDISNSFAFGAQNPRLAFFPASSKALKGAQSNTMIALFQHRVMFRLMVDLLWVSGRLSLPGGIGVIHPSEAFPLLSAIIPGMEVGPSSPSSSTSPNSQKSKLIDFAGFLNPLNRSRASAVFLVEDRSSQFLFQTCVYLTFSLPPSDQTIFPPNVDRVCLLRISNKPELLSYQNITYGPFTVTNLKSFHADLIRTCVKPKLVEAGWNWKQRDVAPTSAALETNFEIIRRLISCCSQFFSHEVVTQIVNSIWELNDHSLGFRHMLCWPNQAQVCFCSDFDSESETSSKGSSAKLGRRSSFLRHSSHKQPSLGEYEFTDPFGPLFSADRPKKIKNQQLAESQETLSASSSRTSTPILINSSTNQTINNRNRTSSRTDSSNSVFQNNSPGSIRKGVTSSSSEFQVNDDPRLLTMFPSPPSPPPENKGGILDWFKSSSRNNSQSDSRPPSESSSSKPPLKSSSSVSSTTSLPTSNSQPNPNLPRSTNSSNPALQLSKPSVTTSTNNTPPSMLGPNSNNNKEAGSKPTKPSSNLSSAPSQKPPGAPPTSSVAPNLKHKGPFSTIQEERELDEPDTRAMNDEPSEEDLDSVFESTNETSREVSPSKRTLSTVLQRIKVLGGKGTLDQSHWMPDSNCTICYDCGVQFTTFRRRHHCRICGQIFCWKCCKDELDGRQVGYAGMLRCCSYCAGVIRDCTSPGKRTLPADELSSTSTFLRAGSEESSFVTVSSPLKHPSQSAELRKESQFYFQHASKFYHLESVISDPGFLEDFLKVFRLAIADGSLAIKDHRERLITYPECFVGSEFVDWLLDCGHIKKRRQGVIVGQALLDCKYIVHVRGEELIFRDEHSLFRVTEAAFQTDSHVLSVDPALDLIEEAAAIKKLRMSFENDDDDPLPAWLEKIPSFEPHGKPLANPDISDEVTSLRSFSSVQNLPGSSTAINIPSSNTDEQLDASMSLRGGMARAPSLPFGGRPAASNSKFLPESHDSDSDTPITHEIPQQAPSNLVLDAASKRVLDDLLSVPDGRVLSRRIGTCHAKHLLKFVRQCLLFHNLAPSWAPTVVELVNQTVKNLRPDISRGDKMDVREYIKIKTLPGAKMADSAFYSGMIFTKNVTHKAMRTDFSNVKILLLGCALEYQRVENKFCTFETLFMQEREYLKKVVDKIASLHPDVVIVQRSVARIAQELILQAGISLMLNVKPSVMKFLARLTQATILRTLDRLNFDPQLGNCEHFELKKVLLADGKIKTLASFEGCNPRKGCTILLRGSASRDELVAVKKVILCASFVAYNLKLEHSYFDNQFATLPLDLVDSNEDDPSIEEACRAILAALKEDHRSITSSLLSSKDSTSRTLEASRFQTMLPHMVLATSPFMEFPVPYLYSETGLSCKLRPSLPTVVHWSPLLHSPDLIPARALDSFSSSQHQNLNVLFTSWVDKTQRPCFPPRLMEMPFCGVGDVALGHFIESYCFDENMPCISDSCQAKMEQHVRTFTTGHGRMVVSMERLANPIPNPLSGENIIFMWSWCRKCSQISPVLPMTELTWMMSFAKFLELSIYTDAHIVRTGLCPHSLHHDHVRCFGKGDLTVQFEYEAITLSELVLPSPALTVTKISSTSSQWEADVVTLEGQAAILMKEAERILAEMDKQEQATLVAQGQATGSTPNGPQGAGNSNNLGSNPPGGGQSASSNPRAMGSHRRQGSLQSDILLATSIGSNAGTTDESNPLSSNQLLAPPSAPTIARSKSQDQVDEAPPTAPQTSPTHTPEKTPPGQLDPPVSPLPSTTIPSGPLTAPISNKAATLLGIPQQPSSIKSNPPSPTMTRHAPPPPPPPKADITPACSPCELVRSKIEDDKKTIRSTLKKLRDSVKKFSEGDLAKQGEEKKEQSLNISPENTLKLEGFAQEIRLSLEIYSNNWNSLFQDFFMPEKEKAKATKKTSLTNNTLPGPPSLVVSPPPPPLSSTPNSPNTNPNAANTFPSSSTTLAPSPLSRPPSAPAPQTQPIAAPPNIASPIFSPISSPPDESLSGPIRHGDETSKLPRLSVGVIESEDDGALSVRSLKSVDVEETPPTKPSTPEPNVDKDEVSVQRFAPKAIVSILANFNPSKRLISGVFPLNHHHTLPRGTLREPISVYEEQPSSIIAYSISSHNYVAFLNNVAPTPSETTSSSSAEKTPEGPHFKHLFSDPVANFYCKVFFAKEFRELRCLLHGRGQDGEDDFLRSISRCMKWNAHGGKSGADFNKTLDDRFILKQMSRSEAQSFVDFAPQYFKHLTTCVRKGRPTALAKIFGVFRIGFRNSKTGLAMKQDVLIMENLFYGRQISRIFDLKGSIRNRYAQNTEQSNDVLLDLNLLELVWDSPLFVRYHSKVIIEHTLKHDTMFLAANNVMDYSLLVGVDSRNAELVVGIIDYVRTFTWDKKLEMYVKSSGILGGHGNLPTIVSPDQYKKRFLDAMERYFMLVPDRWNSTAYLPLGGHGSNSNNSMQSSSNNNNNQSTTSVSNA